VLPSPSLIRFLKLLEQGVLDTLIIFVGMPLPFGQEELASVCLANPPLLDAKDVID